MHYLRTACDLSELSRLGLVYRRLGTTQDVEAMFLHQQHMDFYDEILAGHENCTLDYADVRGEFHF